jgi:hypothetical protein
VRRLVPFPGREFHPLEAPGLAWRTEVDPQVKIDDSCFSLINRFGHSVYRFMRCPFRSVSIRPRLEISFEDWFQDELECSLDQTGLLHVWEIKRSTLCFRCKSSASQDPTGIVLP